MRKRILETVSATLCACAALACTASFAADYAVVDIARVFAESAAGKAASAHVEEVRKILQKGADDILTLEKKNAGGEVPEYKLQEIQERIDRFFNAQSSAVDSIIEAEVKAACSEWLKKNKGRKVDLIISKQLTLANSDSIDVTDGIVKEMDKRAVPEFPPLPEVRIVSLPQQ